MMQPIPPSWFAQRQAKAQPAGDEHKDVLRLTAPNLPEAFIGIRSTSVGRWSSLLKLAIDGPEVVHTSTNYATPEEAWDVAFELYRNHLVN